MAEMNAEGAITFTPDENLSMALHTLAANGRALFNAQKRASRDKKGAVTFLELVREHRSARSDALTIIKAAIDIAVLMRDGELDAKFNFVEDADA